jgi:hypothetical protein
LELGLHVLQFTISLVLIKSREVSDILNVAEWFDIQHFIPNFLISSF